MNAIQLDLFESYEETEAKQLRLEIAQIRKTTDNVRRGVFARQNEMAKLILKQQEEIDQLRHIVAKQTAIYHEPIIASLALVAR